VSGIFNNYFIANCPQYVPVKKFKIGWLIFGKDMKNDKVGCFWGTWCIYAVLRSNIVATDYSGRHCCLLSGQWRQEI